MKYEKNNLNRARLAKCDCVSITNVTDITYHKIVS
jgi:hypothetical protein